MTALVQLSLTVMHGLLDHTGLSIASIPDSSLLISSSCESRQSVSVSSVPEYRHDH
ncbi:unnamed protein product, partial [Allacma fusca]